LYWNMGEMLLELKLCSTLHRNLSGVEMSDVGQLDLRRSYSNSVLVCRRNEIASSE
jgi:hypothetical protein